MRPGPRRGIVFATSLILAACAAPAKEGGGSVDQLVRDLEAGDVSRRVNGLIAARYLGSSARPAVKPVVRLLFEAGAQNIEDGSYVRLASEALAAIGPEITIVELIAAMDGPRADAAADSLLALVRGDPGLGRYLIEALDERRAHPGLEAVLIELGAPCYALVAQHAVIDEPAERRRYLAELLERFQEAPPRALPFVLALLDDASWRVQWAALRALEWQRGREAALPWLCEAARDPDHMLREEAIARAARFGRGRSEVLDLLIGLLEVEHPWVCRQAMRALSGWGRMAQRASTAIERAARRDPVLAEEGRLALAALAGKP